MSARAPANYPCASCPYRRDVPSGVWHVSEYEKLPPYDNDTAEQPMGLFMCHQQNERVCSGWVGCHDMQESMALRIAFSMAVVSQEDYEAMLDYQCPVPLFASGHNAAIHGLRDVADPSEGAQRAIDKLEARRRRRESDATT